MRFRHILIAVAAASAVALFACAGDEPAVDNPDSALTPEQAAARLEGGPPELSRLRDEANELLPGGVDAFEAQLADLRGLPVVANLWASWCGPCRYEFPFFQQQAIRREREVAFLAVDTEDSEDAAGTFLSELPLPYPSISDPDGTIKQELGAVGLPATAFYDSSGELIHLKQGPYESEADLAADIDRYAR
jgi:cytochrome c biogenesis protein CcmG, thiol:disulfide interchange protein DsbE